MDRKHAEHLASVLKNYHEISEDWDGKTVAGIDLIWDYTQKHSGRTFRLSMETFVETILFKVGHKPPVKKKISRTVVGIPRMEARFNKHHKKIHILKYMKKELSEYKGLLETCYTMSDQ